MLETLLATLFTKAGETLTAETIKLALEHRKDIKDKFLNLFNRDELISLGLNENQTPEEVKALINEKPEIKNKLDENQDLLDELAKALSKQEGRTIHAKYYIENVEKGYFS
jgi:hypothetical protein